MILDFNAYLSSFSVLAFLLTVSMLSREGRFLTIKLAPLLAKSDVDVTAGTLMAMISCKIRDTEGGGDADCLRSNFADGTSDALIGLSLASMSLLDETLASTASNLRDESLFPGDVFLLSPRRGDFLLSLRSLRLAELLLPRLFVLSDDGDLSIFGETLIFGLADSSLADVVGNSGSGTGRFNGLGP